MSEITEQSVRQCSLTLGQFDRETVNILVTLFHHQSAGSDLTRLSNDLRAEFEQLLTCKPNEDENATDTPLTRVELAIMILFKQKYLSKLPMPEEASSEITVEFSKDDELNLAYCFLFAQVDDRMSQEKLDSLAFLLSVRPPIHSLLDIYEKSHFSLPEFFCQLLQCRYFATNLVIVDQVIRSFQLFHRRYEEFLTNFERLYNPLSHAAGHRVATNAMLGPNDTDEITSFMSQIISSNRKPNKASARVPVAELSNAAVSHRNNQQSTASSVPSSPHVPKKGLCVIINISTFDGRNAGAMPERGGSDKDVNLIKIIFNKLNFTILECQFDFKQVDFDGAMDHVDDRSEFGDFDCLVMFIMSHGLLHSFFTADSKEIVIRDIVQRFSDSSATTIWAGKSRLFFIQACRSAWPNGIECTNREGIQQGDLSPQMLVAYSCSPNEASKRSVKVGSLFIQIFSIMLLYHSHYTSIGAILDSTARFVTRRDEYVNECKKTDIEIQRPEYLHGGFRSDFRLSTHCLYATCANWEKNKRIALEIPLSIWSEIYDLLHAPQSRNGEPTA